MFNVSNDDPSGKKHGELRNLDLSRWDTSFMNVWQWIFDSQPYIVTEFTVRKSTISSYNNAFSDAATDGGQIIVNYTAASEASADRLISTKSGAGNVIKGNLVP